jgi:photoactive yellow protein
MAIDPAALRDDDLDQLEFGVIGVDRDGVIVRYNRAEAERAGFSRWRVLGRDLAEVAGAMSARELGDRVREFLAADGASAVFTCVLRQRSGARDAAIDATVELIRGRGDAAVYVCVVPEPDP